MKEYEIIDQLENLEIKEIKTSLMEVANMLYIDKGCLSRLIKKHYNLDWREYQAYRIKKEGDATFILDEYANNEVYIKILDKIKEQQKIYIFGNNNCLLVNLLREELFFLKKAVYIISSVQEIINYQNDGLVIIVKEPNKELCNHLPEQYIYIGNKKNNKLEYNSELKIILPCYKFEAPEYHRYVYYMKKIFRNT